MGFLSKLFKRPLTRERWYIKVDLLTELSEIARRHWVRDWDRILTRWRPPQKGEPGAETPQLSAEGDIALRAFQTHLVTHFISLHTYLAAGDQADFTGQLLGSMVGERTPEAVALVERYSEVGDDLEVLFHVAAHDISAGLGLGDAEAAQIQATLPQFTLEQHYITALCFGDTPRVRQLKAEIAAADESALEQRRDEH